MVEEERSFALRQASSAKSRCRHLYVQPRRARRQKTNVCGERHETGGCAIRRGIEDGNCKASLGEPLEDGMRRRARTQHGRPSPLIRLRPGRFRQACMRR